MRTDHGSAGAVLGRGVTTRDPLAKMVPAHTMLIRFLRFLPLLLVACTPRFNDACPQGTVEQDKDCIKYVGQPGTRASEGLLRGKAGPPGPPPALEELLEEAV